MEDSKKELSSKQLAELVVKGMLDKKAKDVVLMDLREIKHAVSDFFVVCSATSDRHAAAVIDGIEETTLKESGTKAWRREGMERKEWILLDYIDVVAHVFVENKRQHYGLEDLWGDAKTTRIDLGKADTAE
ncbi:ribosome silencing factor [Algivirga pacifica]|uniref:Ribosomal silencing factor RsfS n=1 Tax=Algivirga pacifica TaxID=1162670 RepID=A0ABP9CXD8_9BACT